MDSKIKATDKSCFSYDESYDNNCRACRDAKCEKCNLYIPKTDESHIAAYNDFLQKRDLLYYPNGVRR